MASGTLLRGRAILVVENEPLIRLELASLFETAGAHAVAVSTTQQALAALGEHRIRAAVLDYMLQEDDVAALCRHLAERHVPFMFYTGYSELEQNYPGAVIVQKPATREVLLRAMANLIGRAEPFTGEA